MAIPQIPFRKRLDYPGSLIDAFKNRQGFFRIPDNYPDIWFIEGFAPSIGAGVTSMLWDGSATAAYPQGAVTAPTTTMDIVSSSAQDDPPAGTGAYQVNILGWALVDAAVQASVKTVYGIDVEIGSRTPMIETINLNGLVPVTTVAPFSGVVMAYVFSETGSNETPNTGTVTFTRTGGAQVLAVMRAGEGRTYNGWMPRVDAGFGSGGDPKLALVDYEYISQAGQDLTFFIVQAGVVQGYAYPGSLKDLAGQVTERYAYTYPPSGILGNAFTGWVYGIFCTNNGGAPATNVRASFTIASNVSFLANTGDAYA